MIALAEATRKVFEAVPHRPKGGVLLVFILTRERKTHDRSRMSIRFNELRMTKVTCLLVHHRSVLVRTPPDRDLSLDIRPFLDTSEVLSSTYMQRDCGFP